jgi:serine/threonine protein kinase
MTANTTIESKSPRTSSLYRGHLTDPAAIKLLRSGEKLLDAVESSDFCSSAAFHTQVARTYPLFDKGEIKLGPVLGHGGFGIVFEVKEIILKKSSDNAPVEQPVEDSKSPTDHDDDDHDELLDHIDYKNVSNARAVMASNVRRKKITQLPNGDEIEGAARYAVKRLRSDLNDMHRARGTIDLAIEAKFLARLSHPNIIKMRGYASGPSLQPDFFIVLDRLYEILNHRLLRWKLNLFHHGIGIYDNFWQIIFCPHRRYRPKSESDRKETDHIVHEILLERLVIAYDLASAFSYMHKNR